jgi:hypothetical protein
MSIFSKLFPGDVKGEAKSETDAAPAPVSIAEKATPVQRSPNNGREPAAPAQPESQEVLGPLTSQQRASPPQRPAAATQPQSPRQSAGSAAKSPAAKPVVAPPAASPAVVATRAIEIGATGVRAPPPTQAISIGTPTSPAAAPPAATPAKDSAAAAPIPAAKVRPAHAGRPSSVRPTAPEMSPPGPGRASISDTFETLLSLEDVDAGFASLERGSGPSVASGIVPTDLAEVRSLFEQLAANHVRQVRDFMIDLRWSESTSDWLPICEPAMRSLRRAAAKLELSDLCAALDQFAETLAGAQASGDRVVGGERRAALLASYEALSGLMPKAFALDLDRNQRGAIILQALLLQVPGVKKVTLDKMYAAGLTTLEAMFMATAGDLAATSGIPGELAARIVERFRAYREQVKTTVPDATRTRERQRVAELTSGLRRENEEYTRASESWSPEAAEKKKKCRKARAQTLLDIHVMLARLGEVDLLSQLERLPFEGKLAHLDAFLDAARETYTAQF